jgi:hypothetical protein
MGYAVINRSASLTNSCPPPAKMGCDRAGRKVNPLVADDDSDLQESLKAFYQSGLAGWLPGLSSNCSEAWQS